MRHPLLRILIALLVGVWAPICCCRAASMVSDPCDEPIESAPAEDSCCGRGCGSARPNESQHQHGSDEQSLPPGGCKVCPACVGSADASGLSLSKGGSPATPEMSDVPAMVLAPLVVVASDESMRNPGTPAMAAEPGHLRANRSALRWHCALNV